MYVWDSVTFMGAPTAASIVPKLGQRTLLFTRYPIAGLDSHFEAGLRRKSRSKVTFTA